MQNTYLSSSREKRSLGLQSHMMKRNQNDGARGKDHLSSGQIVHNAAATTNCPKTCGKGILSCHMLGPICSIQPTASLASAHLAAHTCNGNYPASSRFQLRHLFPHTRYTKPCAESPPRPGRSTAAQFSDHHVRPNSFFLRLRIELRHLLPFDAQEARSIGHQRPSFT